MSNLLTLCFCAYFTIVFADLEVCVVNQQVPLVPLTLSPICFRFSMIFVHFLFLPIYSWSHVSVFRLSGGEGSVPSGVVQQQKVQCTIKF